MEVECENGDEGEGIFLALCMIGTVVEGWK